MGHIKLGYNYLRMSANQALDIHSLMRLLGMLTIRQLLCAQMLNTIRFPTLQKFRRNSFLAP